MEIRLISFSERGCTKAREIAKHLAEVDDVGTKCTAYSLKKHIKDNETLELNEGLDQWTEKHFAEADGLIFVCAVGIAVRAIAPYVQSKDKDPAVIVIDELGRYVIPALSGHLGGANKLAKEVAESIGAELVLTTATDINNKFAVDTFAKENDLYITDMTMAKKISAAILAGETIGFMCSYPLEGELPAQLEKVTEASMLPLNIYIGTEDKAFQNTLQLMPKNYVLGTGCRKEKDSLEFEKAVLEILEDANMPIEKIGTVASIDLKKDEKAIREFCRKYRIKKKFYAAEELLSVKGDFTASKFVSETTGVDNVCERAAVAASKGGALTLKKNSMTGVTVAIAKIDEKEVRINFE